MSLTNTYSPILTIEDYDTLRQRSSDTDKGNNLIIVPNPSGSVEKDMEGNENSFTIKLTSLSLKKEVYKPNELEAIVKLSWQNESNMPDISKIRVMFMRKRASLEFSIAVTKSSTTTYTIEEKGYFVYEVCQVLDSSNVKELTVKLKMASLDKLMTIDKYSQAYLGRKLRAELIKSTNRFTLGYEYIDNKGDRKYDATPVPVYNETDEKEEDYKYYEIVKDEKGDPILNEDGTQKMKELVGKRTVKYNKLFLQHLGSGNFLRKITENNTEKYCSLQHEFIHPYLVQYNESFYDFLVRIANRCGEFLYFEDGKLTVGLLYNPSSTITASSVANNDKTRQSISSSSFSNVSEVTDYQSIIFAENNPTVLDIKSYSRDSLKDNDNLKPTTPENSPKSSSQDGGEILYKYTGIKKKFKVPGDANFVNKNYPYTYNSEIAHDEFFMPLFYDGFETGEMDHVEKKIPKMFLQTTSLFDFLSDIIDTTIMSALEYGFYKDMVAERGRKRFIDPNLPSNTSNVDNWNEKTWEIASLEKEPSVVVPFSENNSTRWTTLEYYADIRKYQEILENRIIEIDMGNNIRKFQLGQIIKVPKSSDYYVVIDVEWEYSYSTSTIKEENDNSKNDTPTITARQKVKAIPLYSYYKKESKTPSYFIAYPPVSKFPVFRESGPQNAIVVDSADPKRQGRVRIRYPWQSNVAVIPFDSVNIPKSEEDILQKYNEIKTEAATPWIRMATPAASKKAGIYFEAEPGDEVLVNFENNNVERPYVVGALYSKNHPSLSSSGRRIIKSRLGHTIRFNDPTGGEEDEVIEKTGISRFLGTLSPLLAKQITFFGRNFPTFEGETVEKLTGGIDIKDAYGIYNISMSSDKRSVKIGSPYGTVSLNAFTGITISAPNGNIKIEGKNIDIKASNKVNIESGINIKDEHYVSDFTSWKSIGISVAKSARSHLFDFQPIDLKLVRNVFEIFLRPIDGTLNLKSHGFLRLEAGEGSAQVPKDKYTDWYLKNEDKNRANYRALTTVYETYYNIIETVKKLADSHLKEIKGTVETMRKVMDKFVIDFINPNHLVTPNTRDGLVDLLFQQQKKDFGRGDLNTNSQALIQKLGGGPRRQPSEKKYESYLKELNNRFNSLWQFINHPKRGLKNMISHNYLESKIGWVFEKINGLSVATHLRQAITALLNGNNDTLFGLSHKLLNSPNNANMKIMMDLTQNDDQNHFRDDNTWQTKKIILQKTLIKNMLSQFATLFPDFTLTLNINNLNIADNTAWDNEINNLKIEINNQVMIEGSNVRDVITWFTEDWVTGLGRNIWEGGSDVKGKILMSDNAGATLLPDANGTGFMHTNNDNAYLFSDKTPGVDAKLKKKLRNIN